jgi:chemotaxis protein CheD
MAFGSSPARVNTVLGSCVSVTLFAPERRVGAICHALLPRASEAERYADFGCRYVDVAIRRMLSEFTRLGIRPRQLVTKLFGGSDLMAALTGKNTNRSVGSQNIETALWVLGREGLTVAASDVGGTWGRKLVFFTHTGDVFIKRHSRSSSTEAPRCPVPRNLLEPPSKASPPWDPKSKS